MFPQQVHSHLLSSLSCSNHKCMALHHRSPSDRSSRSHHHYTTHSPAWSSTPPHPALRAALPFRPCNHSHPPPSPYMFPQQVHSHLVSSLSCSNHKCMAQHHRSPSDRSSRSHHHYTTHSPAWCSTQALLAA